MTASAAEAKEDPRRPALPLDVLVADDEESIRVTLSDDLEEVGHRVTTVATGDEALAAIASTRFDVVITDLRMPGADGLEVVKAVEEKGAGTEVILITAHGSVESAVEAMRHGAYHYVLKPFLNDELLLLVARVARIRKLERENRSLHEDLGRLEGFENVIGASTPMVEVLNVVRTVAKTDASILIEGESGTGKEVIARSIHRNSERRDGPFVALSCAALPETLLEAELFGHEAGAFTDAKKARHGRFELADGGTLFLDDVDDLGLPVQVKLLRALQERVIERVGGEKPIGVDIRVVTATKKNLAELMQEGKFREDLFYRLNVVPLRLPPLRERVEDVPLLVHHFVRRLRPRDEYEVPSDVMDALCLYPWPGNVRELENSVERASAMAGDSRTLKKEHLLLPSPRFKNAAHVPATTTLKEVVRAAEIEHIKRVLKTTGNHKAQAAALLGISRKNLWEKMKEYEFGSD
ncbi:MAG: sigma-54-dependent transcriptional regulator [Planctomycetota bacterium JB042]